MAEHRIEGAEPADTPSPEKVASSGLAVQVLIFVLCAVCGSLLPVLTDWTKEFPVSYIDPVHNEIQSCRGKSGLDPQCKGALPYLPEAEVFVEACVSLSVGVLVTLMLSGWQGLRMCVRPWRLKQTAVIGLVYAAGDIMQIMAIDATSAAFFLIVGQMKLIATAILARAVLNKGQSYAQWLLLAAISIGCVLYLDLELVLLHGKGGGEFSYFGLFLSLVKVVLAAGNAVLTERSFKAAPDEPIWVNQTQLKLCAAPAALLIMSLRGFLFCKPGTCFPDLGGGIFHGMGWKVVALILFQIFNASVIGMMYKRIDSVVKYLAYAQSLWLTYFINMAMHGVPFVLELFLLVVLLVLLVIAYTLAAPSPKSVIEGSMKKTK